MTVKQVLSAWLTEHGFDGLCNSEVPCGCLANELAPCEGAMTGCEPGYREDMLATDHWHVTTLPMHPGFLALLADAPNWVCLECGESPDQASGRWRWAGELWEHHHGYPVGHVAAERRPKETKPLDSLPVADAENAPAEARRSRSLQPDVRGEVDRG